MHTIAVSAKWWKYFIFELQLYLELLHMNYLEFLHINQSKLEINTNMHNHVWKVQLTQTRLMKNENETMTQTH